MNNITSEKAKGPAVAAASPLKTEQSGRKFSAKSTATEAQLQKLIALTRITPRNTHEMRRHGISHPAGRVLDLTKRGYCFASDRITTVDSDGFTHRGVALYTLVSGPDGQQPQ